MLKLVNDKPVHPAKIGIHLWFSGFRLTGIKGLGMNGKWLGRFSRLFHKFRS